MNKGSFADFKIGTRGSALALAQAEGVRAQVAALTGGATVELEIVKTLGDQLSAQSVETISDEPIGAGSANLNPAHPNLAPYLEDSAQGIFTKELDEALLSGKIRAAVHSLKDVPTILPPGIRYGAFLKRGDPRDVLVSASGLKFFELPGGSKIGTSSPRREAQIRSTRSDLVVVPLRGNVDTRLRKLRQGEMDAIVLAAAGMARLGSESQVTEYLEPTIMLPSPAQGVLSLTILESDGELLELLKPLDDFETRVCAEAERAFLRTLQGGCRIPVGALARVEGETLFLSGVIAHPNGEQIMKNQSTGSVRQPKELGNQLAKAFLENGALDILNGFGRSFE